MPGRRPPDGHAGAVAQSGAARRPIDSTAEESFARTRTQLHRVRDLCALAVLAGNQPESLKRRDARSIAFASTRSTDAPHCQGCRRGFTGSTTGSLSTRPAGKRVWARTQRAGLFTVISGARESARAASVGHRKSPASRKRSSLRVAAGDEAVRGKTAGSLRSPAALLSGPAAELCVRHR